MMTRRVTVLAASVDVVFFGFFLWADSPLLAWLNVLIVCLYAAANRLLVWRWSRCALVLIWLEVVGHAVIGTLWVGWEAGFNYYLLMFIPTIMVSGDWPRVGVPLGVLFLTYLGLHVASNELGQLAPIGNTALVLLNVFNVSSFFAMATYTARFYYLLVRRTEGRLREHAMRDTLTGLFNRRHLIALADIEMARGQRDGTPLSLVLVDIDLFKQINDGLGHDAGDRVLVHVSRLFLACCRTSDTVARWGGEEFLFLLPNTAADAALGFAERLRGAVATQPLTWEGVPVACTVSLGVTTPASGETLQEGIARADQARFPARAPSICMPWPRFRCFDRGKLQLVFSVRHRPGWHVTLCGRQKYGAARRRRYPSPDHSGADGRRGHAGPGGGVERPRARLDRVGRGLRRACARGDRGVGAGTGGPFNVNFFCHAPPRSDAAVRRTWLDHHAPRFGAQGVEPPLDLQDIYPAIDASPGVRDVILAEAPPVVSFHFGLPGHGLIAAIHGYGGRVLVSVTPPPEADAAVGAGADALVGQGVEAGGHRGNIVADRDTETGLIALLRTIVRRHEVPVIAARGLMDGAAIHAVMVLGAAAAQLGTAFVACPESAASPAYRDALRAGGDTGLTRAISGRPARGLIGLFHNPIALGAPRVPDYPLAYDAAKRLHAAATAAGEHCYAPNWAGQGVGLLREKPAAELIGALTAERELARPGPG